MSGFDAATLGSIGATEFATLVKQTPDREIRDALAGPQRRPILDEIFGRFPGMFRPERAEGVAARINFRITGGPGDSSDTYAVVVQDGACTVERDPATEPTVSFMAGPVEFLKLITGDGNPVMMVMMGKVKVRGDLALAQNFAKYFDAS